MTRHGSSSTVEIAAADVSAVEQQEKGANIKSNKKGLICLTLREGGPASSVELQASLALLVERHLLALLNI